MKKPKLVVFSDLVSFYGTEANAGRSLKTSRQGVNRWKETGIPFRAQVLAELDSDGELRANIPPEVIEVVKRRLAEERKSARKPRR